MNTVMAFLPAAALMALVFTFVGLIGWLCEPRQHRYPRHPVYHYGRARRDEDDQP